MARELSEVVRIGGQHDVSESRCNSSDESIDSARAGAGIGKCTASALGQSGRHVDPVHAFVDEGHQRADDRRTAPELREDVRWSPQLEVVTMGELDELPSAALSPLQRDERAGIECKPHAQPVFESSRRSDSSSRSVVDLMPSLRASRTARSTAFRRPARCAARSNQALRLKPSSAAYRSTSSSASREREMAIFFAGMP